jgi:hypothetical protein
VVLEFQKAQILLTILRVFVKRFTNRGDCHCQGTEAPPLQQDCHAPFSAFSGTRNDKEDKRFLFANRDLGHQIKTVLR